MCLTVTKNRLKSRFKNGRVILYKLLDIEFDSGEYNIDGINISKHLEAPYTGTIYKAGWNEADNPIDIILYAKGIGSEIGAGAIHVYTSKKATRGYVHSRITVPVICYKKDFIACGTNGDACFTKVYLRKKDYDRALKGKGV